MKKIAYLILIATLLTAPSLACSRSDSERDPRWYPRASALGRAARSKPFLAGAKREVYHRSDCRWAVKISDDNLLGYDKQTDAEADGFRPCEVCKPGQESRP